MGEPKIKGVFRKMEQGSSFCLVFWTAKDKQEAEEISKELLEEKKVACITIFPEVHSLFLWKGRIEKEKEVKILLKTKKEKVSEIMECIQKRSSYEISEILQVSVDRGNPSYLRWIEESLRS